MSGSAGWAWNSAGLSVVPLELRLTGTPLDFLSFGLGGGYKVIPYDLHDQLSASPYALPTGLLDDNGWFGDFTTQLTLTRELATTVMFSVQQSNAMPVGSTTMDSATGLLPIAQRPGIRMYTDLGLRWGITQAISLSADFVYDYMDRPFFIPPYSVAVELIGLEGTGRFGGSLSMNLAPPPAGVLQLPVLRATAFWKVSDAVTLQLEGNDLLWPLLDGPRYDIAPYVTPGIRVTGLLKISL